MQKYRNALFPSSDGIGICQRAELPPDDLQRMPNHHLIAVLILCSMEDIHFYQRGKADALCKPETITRVCLRRVQKMLLPFCRASQRIHQQLLLPLSAFLQLELQCGFFSQLIAQPQQNAGEVLLLKRFQQIILHTIFQRILCIFKFSIPADDDKMQIRLQLFGPLDQLNPAASRHPDVRDQ